MIMHLPRELAVQTLGDFTSILSSNLKDANNKKDGEENTIEAQKVLIELENFKTHVIENNHIDEVFVEPLLVAIAEMNGEKAADEDKTKKEHEDLSK